LNTSPSVRAQSVASAKSVGREPRFVGVAAAATASLVRAIFVIAHAQRLRFGWLSRLLGRFDLVVSPVLPVAPIPTANKALTRPESIYSMKDQGEEKLHSNNILSPYYFVR
jgi:hypothetical protein